MTTERYSRHCALSPFQEILWFKDLYNADARTYWEISELLRAMEILVDLGITPADLALQAEQITHRDFQQWFAQWTVLRQSVGDPIPRTARPAVAVSQAPVVAVRSYGHADDHTADLAAAIAHAVRAGLRMAVVDLGAVRDRRTRIAAWIDAADLAVHYPIGASRPCPSPTRAALGLAEGVLWKQHRAIARALTRLEPPAGDAARTTLGRDWLARLCAAPLDRAAQAAVTACVEEWMAVDRLGGTPEISSARAWAEWGYGVERWTVPAVPCVPLYSAETFPETAPWDQLWIVGEPEDPMQYWMARWLPDPALSRYHQARAQLRAPARFQAQATEVSWNRLDPQGVRRLHATPVTRAPPFLPDLAVTGIPVRDPPRGITRILRLQARCPFQAFATLRLGLQPPSFLGVGLDPRTEWQWIQGVLAAMWRELQDLQTLQGSTDRALHRILVGVSAGVERTLPLTLAAAALQLERRRVLRRLARWWTFERTRKQPFVCIGTEVMGSVVLRGHTVTIRADRVEQYPDGRRGIWNYKTGVAHFARVVSDPTEDPALALCGLSDPDLAVLGSGIVDPQQPRWEGMGQSTAAIALEDLPLEVLDPDAWQRRLQAWEARLGETFQAYQDLRCAPDPREGAETCAQCFVVGLCRHPLQ